MVYFVCDMDMFSLYSSILQAFVECVINDIHECCKKYTVHILYNKSRMPTMLHLGCELHTLHVILFLECSIVYINIW